MKTWQDAQSKVPLEPCYCVAVHIEEGKPIDCAVVQIDDGGWSGKWTGPAGSEVVRQLNIHSCKAFWIELPKCA